METKLFMKFKQANPREGLVVELFYEGYSLTWISKVLKTSVDYAREAIVHWWKTDKGGAPWGRMNN